MCANLACARAAFELELRAKCFSLNLFACALHNMCLGNAKVSEEPARAGEQPSDSRGGARIISTQVSDEASCCTAAIDPNCRLYFAAVRHR
jgi:hypothetical protein